MIKEAFISHNTGEKNKGRVICTYCDDAVFWISGSTALWLIARKLGLPGTLKLPMTLNIHGNFRAEQRGSLSVLLAEWDLTPNFPVVQVMLDVVLQLEP